jgi:hypothetical protein
MAYKFYCDFLLQYTVIMMLIVPYLTYMKLCWPS